VKQAFHFPSGRGKAPFTFPAGVNTFTREFECNKNFSVHSGNPDHLKATKKRGEKAPSL